jgi:H+-translocating NAD(P) transhydrogenase subunit beta
VNRELVIQAAYLAACVLFIFGLRSLTRPETARRGMRFAAIGMLLAILGTLLHHDIVTYGWILGGLTIGAIIGYPLGMWVPMTAMPQRIAISLSFAALAATLVGVAEYYTALHVTVPSIVGAVATSDVPGLSAFKMGAIGFEVMLGAIAVTGSFMAFGKLQGFIPERPITYRGQNATNFLLAVAVLTLLVLITMNPRWETAFYVMILLAALLGVLFVVPIGGADMPVVITLLNSS